MSYSYSSDYIFPLIATSATFAAGALFLLQTDRVSRKILNPTQLGIKRREEYKYNWKKSVEKVKLQIDYVFAGGLQKYNDDPEIVMKNVEYVSKDEDLDLLVEKITDKNDSENIYFTLKIDKDPDDPSEEIYLFIMQEKRQKDTINIESIKKVLYQVPMVEFVMKLVKAFENNLTSTTLCFVADASSGMGTDMLQKLMKEAKTGVPVISEPFWMVQVARLAEARLFPSTTIKKTVYALSRLDAWSVRHEVDSGNTKTVMFTLPGQTTVATLLPLIQNVFPEDRHVFAYDGCVTSVKRGLLAERIFKRGELSYRLEPIIQGMCQDPIRLNNPLPSSTPLSHNFSLGGEGGRLDLAFSQVPIQQAKIVESWMSSVDAYFKLKQDESTNGYLPYCLKLGFLTGDFEHGTDSYWSLNSLLQYVTGCRSRAIHEGVMDAAREWMKDFNKKQTEASIVVSENERKMIENCCFQHKQILIGNKTLLDTVLPKEHWTMKQASRAGCSCCGPDPYDEMEEEEEKVKKSKSIDISSSIENFRSEASKPTNSNWTDGTKGFVNFL